MRERERGGEFKGERETIEDWRERGERQMDWSNDQKAQEGLAPRPPADRLLVHSIEDGIPCIRFDI